MRRNRRGQYPQFFIRYDGSYFFAGDWEKIEGLNDISQLGEDQLANIKAADPDFQTLDELFATCELVGQAEAEEDEAEEAGQEVAEHKQ